MKFEIDREALLRPLQLIAGVVERRQTMPILSNACVRASEDGGLTIAGTDLSMELVAHVESVDVAVGGEITTSAHKLADIWRSLPENAKISFETDGEQAVMRSGRSRFTLATLPVDDYPTGDEAAGKVEFTLTTEEACELIDRVSFAMAQQDVRYFLNGMLLEVTSEHVRSVSTDGHRLAQCTLDKGVEGTERHQAIVPRKTVVELRRLLDGDDGEARFSLSENQIRVACGAFSLTGKLIDGRFPDYERVIPRDPALSLSGDKSTLNQALQRARILTNEKFPGVKLMIEGEQMTIVANNPEQEEAREEVPVAYEGDNMQLGFNVGYLQDVLRAVGSETIRISMAEPGSSALMEGEGDESAVYVVMPMKI